MEQQGPSPLHKIPPNVPILNRIKPVHDPYRVKIHFNIILPFVLGFQHQNLKFIEQFLI